MEAWQKRVQEEYNELMDKVLKLEAYLEKNENEDLKEQLKYMTSYGLCLVNRISKF